MGEAINFCLGLMTFSDVAGGASNTEKRARVRAIKGNATDMKQSILTLLVLDFEGLVSEAAVCGAKRIRMG